MVFFRVEPASRAAPLGTSFGAHAMFGGVVFLRAFLAADSRVRRASASKTNLKRPEAGTTL